MFNTKKWLKKIQKDNERLQKWNKRNFDNYAEAQGKLKKENKIIQELLKDK